MAKVSGRTTGRGQVQSIASDRKCHFQHRMERMEFALLTPETDCCGQSCSLQVAVESLDMAMFEGQILALLGHNGAGKSTTINMHPVQK